LRDRGKRWREKALAKKALSMPAEVKEKRVWPAGIECSLKTTSKVAINNIGRSER